MDYVADSRAHVYTRLHTLHVTVTRSVAFITLTRLHARARLRGYPHVTLQLRCYVTARLRLVYALVTRCWLRAFGRPRPLHAVPSLRFTRLRCHGSYGRFPDCLYHAVTLRLPGRAVARTVTPARTPSWLHRYTHTVAFWFGTRTLRLRLHGCGYLYTFTVMLVYSCCHTVTFPLHRTRAYAALVAGPHARLTRTPVDLPHATLRYTRLVTHLPRVHRADTHSWTRTPRFTLRYGYGYPV